MPRSPRYGIRAHAPALGVLRERGAAASAYPAGMVARWTLDDTGGLVDLIGGLTFTPSGTVSSAAGVIGQARSFNGSSYLATPGRSELSLLNGFAFEVWAYPTGGASEVVVSMDDTGGGRQWALRRSGASAWEFYTINSVGGANQCTGGVCTLNTWHHIVGTLTGTSMKMYVNGEHVGSATFSGSLPTVLGRLVVADRPVASTFWRGRVDELAIYQFGASGDPGAAYWLARYNSGAGRRP